MIKKSTVAIGYGNDRIECLRRAFSALGGIGRWVKPGHRVLLKPNIMASMGTPTITHIDMLKGLYFLCKEAGAKEIMVGDNPVCGMPSRKHFAGAGYTLALEQIGCNVVHFDEGDWVYRYRPGNFCLKDMHIPRAIADADVWITVPVAKTHEACVTTLGIKNSHGILPDEDKARHHRGRPEAGSSLWEKFVDILATCKANLCVTDMFQAMEGQGPAFGKILEPRLVVVSDDVVACDTVVQELMGIDSLTEAPLTRIAHQRGIGLADISRIEVVGERIESHRRKFVRAKWYPEVDMPEGLVVLAGDICHGGCQMILRYLIDTCRIALGKEAREFGPTYILCGDRPPAPPEDRFILVFGDCAIYSTWHYRYRQKPKRIGPWWAPRPGYADVPGCCPVQLGWIRGFANLLRGYAPLVSIFDGLEIVEAERYSFAEGVPLEKNPRRWTWDKEWARKYSREIAASHPPPYIYAANESVKGNRLKDGVNPVDLDVTYPREYSRIQTVESYALISRNKKK